MHIYITFKSAVKHRQYSYGYPRGQTYPPSRGNHSVVYNTCTLLLNDKKYNVGAILDAPDNVISGNEPSSEMLTG